MKKLFLLFSITMLAACSSMSPKTEDLKQADKCTVWKDGILGSKTVVEVEGEVAKQKVTCWLWNTFACTYTDYTFRDGGNEILSSLPPADKTIGTLTGNRMTVTMSGITVDPFDLKDERADYVLQGPIGPKQTMAVEYNHVCSKRQAALGLLTMIGR